MADEQTVDNSSNSPSTEGQEQATAESLDQKLNAGLDTEEQTTEPTEQQSTEQSEELTQEEKELLAGKFESPDELEQAYQELESKLGERNEYAQYARQIEQVFNENPEIPAMIQAYDQGLIDESSIQQIQQALGQETPGQQQPNQPQQQQQQNVPPELQQQMQQQQQQMEEIMLNDMEQSVTSDYQQLQEQYGDTLESTDVSVEDLVDIANQHNMTKQGNFAEVPDVEQAFKYHLMNNEQSLQSLAEQLINQGKQQAQQTNQQKRQAQVESASTRGNQEPQSPEDAIKQSILDAPGGGGGAI